MTGLIYVHDPMCSWCWGFRPTLLTLCKALAKEIAFTQLLGGLAPDSDEPMTEALQYQLQATWRRIQEKLPGTRFNFDFWQNNQPRRSTYPACRAVIAARQLNPAKVEEMILAIQEAYYLRALNPSDDAVLVQLAGEAGMDTARFAQLLNQDKTQGLLDEEIRQSRLMGVNSFPALVLQQGAGYWPVPLDYQNTEPMLETIALLRD